MPAGLPPCACGKEKEREGGVGVSERVVRAGRVPFRPPHPALSLPLSNKKRTHNLNVGQLVGVDLARRAQGVGGRVVEVVAGRARGARRRRQGRQRDGAGVAAPPQQVLAQGPAVGVGNEGKRVVLDQLGGRPRRELGQDAGDERVEGQRARRGRGVEARNVGVDAAGGQAGADRVEDVGSQAAGEGLFQGAGGGGWGRGRASGGG